MEHLALALAAFFVAGLTLYSGFGLGTLMLPAYALFLPLEVAVAATAVVHGTNNLLKVAMTRREADRRVVVHFGLPAVGAAFVGAALLGLTAELGELGRWTLRGREAIVTPVGVIMGLLMAVFALFELLPRLRALKFDPRHLVVGGLLSGFFGGLSGHQGALRSAFLAKAGLTPPRFVATNAMIGLLVDAARLVVYLAAALVAGAAGGSAFSLSEVGPLVASGIVGATAGVLVGLRWLRKMTMERLRTIVGVLLLLLAAAVGSGLV